MAHAGVASRENSFICRLLYTLQIALCCFTPTTILNVMSALRAL